MITLHAHSNYSLLNGTIKVEELVEFALGQNSSYVSLTDTNAMYGLVQFAKLAAEHNIKPILGVLIDNPDNQSESCLFIAKSKDGYSQICRFITDRKIREDFKLIDLFNEKMDDVFIITSSFELLNKIELSSSIRKNLYIELIITDKQKSKTRELYNYAIENNIKFVASHPAYFKHKEDYELHQVVTAIRKNTTLAGLDKDKNIDPEFYLKSSREYMANWSKLPLALHNLETIVNSCNVDLGLGKYKFPLYPLPSGETSYSYLWKICFKGLEERYKIINEKMIKRLSYELEIIDELGFTDYFLVVWDIVREANMRRMMNVGRGSGANSLVAYCLNFHQVDPIAHNLYFERFLNRARKSPPDIDIDFSWAERDDLVKYIFKKHGYDRVAMISTTVRFRARSAFREVAKVYGLTDQEINEYRKYIPMTSAKNLSRLAELFPESKTLKNTFENEPFKSIINIASQLSEFPRHQSIHPGGIVIAPNKITDYTALEYASNKGIGLIVTQPDMYSIEYLGLVKIDILSQRSLGVLRDSIDMIDQNMTDLNVYPT